MIKYSECLVDKAKAIVMSNNDIPAILSHSKTQMRIPIRKQDKSGDHIELLATADIDTGKCIELFAQFTDGKEYKAPYGVGDILYVKEAFKENEYCSHISTTKVPKYLYKADYEENSIANQDKFKPAITMPRDAARIFLKITDVRIDRLNNISQLEACREGVNRHASLRSLICKSPKSRFKAMWDAKYAKKYPKITWGNNPYVWVYRFEIIHIR